MFVTSPTVSMVFTALGVLAVACEFLRPGSVVPGVVGSLLLVFAAHSLYVNPPDWSLAWPWALGLLLPVVVVLAFLFVTALRARRNKRLTIS
jgi:membrane-bound ClpP family serine protease